MAKVTTPDGKTFDEMSQSALAYYRREPGYTVDENTAPVASIPEATVESAVEDDPPKRRGSHHKPKTDIDADEG